MHDVILFGEVILYLDAVWLVLTFFFPVLFFLELAVIRIDMVTTELFNERPDENELRTNEQSLQRTSSYSVMVRAV